MQSPTIVFDPEESTFIPFGWHWKKGCIRGFGSCDRLVASSASKMNLVKVTYKLSHTRESSPLIFSSPV